LIHEDNLFFELSGRTFEFKDVIQSVQAMEEFIREYKFSEDFEIVHHSEVAGK
jgi:hypothetical protein